MEQSIIQQFSGAIGPAFDCEDLKVVLGSGRLAFAKAYSNDGVISAVERAISLLSLPSSSQIAGLAALVVVPAAHLTHNVRLLTDLLCAVYGENVDMVAGGLATEEEGGARTAAVSLWVRCV